MSEENIENELEEVKKEDYVLPSSVTVLDSPCNGKVYLIGTAHFSVKSQQEVAEVSYY